MEENAEEEIFIKKDKALLKALTSPVFLAGYTRTKKSVLTIYVSKQVRKRFLKQEIRKAETRLNITVKFQIKIFDPTEISHQKSLEDLMSSFVLEKIIWDPTDCIQRALCLIHGTKQLRLKFGDTIESILFEPWKRTLYLVFNPNNFYEDNKICVSLLKQTEQDIACIVNNMADELNFSPSIRMGFDKPLVPVLAVDKASYEPKTGAMGPKKRRLAYMAATMAAFWGMHLAIPYAVELPPISVINNRNEMQDNGSDGKGQIDSATANFLPAVSQTNFKSEISASNVDGKKSVSASGSMAFPIGKRFGGQVEVTGQNTVGDFMRGIGGHLFWRDPETSLFGLTAANVDNDDFDLTRLGVESEFYFDQFTIFASTGYQFSDFGNDHPYYSVDLRWYINDNIALTAGTENFNDDWISRVQLEYLSGFEALPGLTTFTDGAVSTDDYSSVRFGFRYYFGDEKTLKRRHREDDPRNTLPLMLFNLQEEITIHQAKRIAAPGPYG